MSIQRKVHAKSEVFQNEESVPYMVTERRGAAKLLFVETTVT